ncbi:MAG: hypothetical protein P4L71_20150 [Acetobacteraceae bacterium]|nr:hypothetical protein [Acetobacteraceae bacterium]
MSRYSSRYEDQWPAYVPVSERKRQAEALVATLRKKGQAIAPVTLEGRVIASTFWGKAWCDNLESYRDYDNRLERGRSYVRNGSVVDLQIAPNTLTAMVNGSELYRVRATIAAVPAKQWKAICKDCTGGIDSLVELLQGRFAKGVMERICRQGDGLFPQPSEIRFSCNCGDYASMCKHVAAVFYGVGARLDAQPELLFRLRGVNEKDLVAQIGSVSPLAKSEAATGKVLDAADLSALFGLDMDVGEGAAADRPPAAARKPARARKVVAAAPPVVKPKAGKVPAVRRASVAAPRPGATGKPKVVKTSGKSGPAVRSKVVMQAKGKASSARTAKT